MPDETQGRRVLLAGLVDSFGLSLGWTTFTLIAVERAGLGAAAVYNAAMLMGIVASAPATAWLCRRLSGGRLLALAGLVELPLRLSTLAALLMGVGSAPISVGVFVMNVAAWTGYAGMRAEVAECDPGARAMVRYAVGIAAIEAVAASVAALLPVAGHGPDARIAVAVVFVLYGGSLAPQFWCARNARVLSGRSVVEVQQTVAAMGIDGVEMRSPGTGRPRREVWLLVAGTAIMLIASGPATLNTALAADLYGHYSVVAASIAFTLGCLSATRVTSLVAGLGLGLRTVWTAWSLGMAVGWLLAPWSIVGLLVAQVLSGLCLTAFHGEMDSAVADAAPARRLTAALARAGALRAIGSAAAVRALPLFIGQVGLITYVTGVVAVLVIGYVAALAAAPLGQRVAHRFTGSAAATHLADRGRVDVPARP